MTQNTGLKQSLGASKLRSCRGLISTLVFCRHMCMVMRGVQKMNSRTVTSAMLGVYLEDPKTREEFLYLSRRT